MSEFNHTTSYASTGDSLREYILGVFTKMGIGLGLTAATAYACYRNLMAGGLMYKLLIQNYSMVFLIVTIAQLVLCVNLSARLDRMSTSSATGSFYGYAVLTGITFSVLPLRFNTATVFGAFLFAAVLFISCSVIGHTTKVDLTQFSGLMIGGLVALVIVSVLSMFIPSLAMSRGISYLGLILFLGITAWDMQRLKAMYYQMGRYNDTLSYNLSIFGAFQLYLDFLNIFLYVLRIMGSRNSRN